MTGAGASAPTCCLCGRAADAATEGDPPLGWSSDRSVTAADEPPRWICPQCTRRYVRSIEAKLDHDYW